MERSRLKPRMENYMQIKLNIQNNPNKYAKLNSWLDCTCHWELSNISIISNIRFKHFFLPCGNHAEVQQACPHVALCCTLYLLSLKCLDNPSASTCRWFVDSCQGHGQTQQMQTWASPLPELTCRQVSGPTPYSTPTHCTYTWKTHMYSKLLWMTS